MFDFGQVYGLTVAMYTLKNLDEGNWRLYYRLTPAVMVVAVVLMYCFLKESPRYFILVKDFKKGVMQCQKMLDKTKKKDPKFKNLWKKLKNWKIRYLYEEELKK